MVNIKVHRGLHQIGGCITEIWTDNSRVFIDLGQYLVGYAELTTPEEDAEMVKGLFTQNKKEHEAVFYTHGHEDHIGLFMYVPDDVPQYLSKGTQEILLAKYELVAESHKKSLKKADVDITREYYQEVVNEDNRRIERLKSFKTWESTTESHKPVTIHIGDISITPFPCSHSIYDASMFLIEAKGKRIWHTGDFRNNGFLPDIFPVLRKYAVDIDTLIIEGTMLTQDIVNITEEEVSDKMSHVMKAFKYVFVMCSATDIDRLAAVQRACELSEKKLYVCSDFMKRTMEIFTRREGMRRKLYHFEAQLYKDKVPSSIMKKEGFVMAISASSYRTARQMRDALDPSETLLIYSNWDGYYKIPEQVEKSPAYSNFRKLFPNVVDIHTSGHADRKTLKRFIEVIKPKEIIGIHKEESASIESLFHL